ncbi:MAG: YggS family pyridoxal phosphate-dependent enzyme [Bacteroidota bacterium]
MALCDSLQSVRETIQQTCQRTGRSVDDVQLIAVSKTRPVESIRSAHACGQIRFGENRARELQSKMEELDDLPLEWHFIGPLQTNKIKYMAPRVDWIHSVYKKKYFKEIEKRAARENRVIQSLIQINISNEDQKQGIMPDELASLLDYTANLNHVRVRGLMGMASHTDDYDRIRRQFILLRETLESHLRMKGGSNVLDHLSMGMSHDLEIAIEEGATMVRIGSAIFGERD